MESQIEKTTSLFYCLLFYRLRDYVLVYTSQYKDLLKRKENNPYNSITNIHYFKCKISLSRTSKLFSHRYTGVDPNGISYKDSGVSQDVEVEDDKNTKDRDIKKVKV